MKKGERAGRRGTQSPSSGIIVYLVLCRRSCSSVKRQSDRHKTHKAHCIVLAPHHRRRSALFSLCLYKRCGLLFVSSSLFLSLSVAVSISPASAPDKERARRGHGGVVLGRGAAAGAARVAEGAPVHRSAMIITVNADCRRRRRPACPHRGRPAQRRLSSGSSRAILTPMRRRLSAGAR